MGEGFIFVDVENISRPSREWNWGRECVYWHLGTQVEKESFNITVLRGEKRARE